MHAHVMVYPELAYPLFIAHGVTGLRELGQRGGLFTPDSFRVWQREIAAGRLVGPRVLGASYDLDFGACGVDIPHGPFASLESMRLAVDSIKAAGFALLKLHGGMYAVDGKDARTTFFALAAEARRIGLPFAGHLSGVTAAEASDSGQRSIEHFNEDLSPCRTGFGVDDGGSLSWIALDERECAALARCFVRNGTWFTPTLAFAFNLGAGDYSPEHLRKVAAILTPFTRAGFPMLAGTDVLDFSESPKVWPGKWLHDELLVMVASGMTPLDALRTATPNPAKYWGATDSLGSVAPGRLADLVLLDANPLADIGNTSRIRAVVANGRYFDRAALDSLVAEVTLRWPQRKKLGNDMSPKGDPMRCGH